ncbi:MAG: protein kinase [Myxococcota bacterium]
MLPVGTILDGRYTITGTLGEGGFATVYRTRHQFLHSTHAIKVLLPHLANDPEMRSRFLSEGRIQAGLRHPNIIAVTDIVTDPVAGLVMELIEGPTLTQLLAERVAALEPREIAVIMLPLLDAVGAAHAAGVVHRDLKPDNVLVTRRGTDLWPVVGDFGIAKVLEASALDAGKQRTRTGMRMGTLHYMSPEQIRGSSNVDARADIFALGAILYECATGRPAFAGDSEFDTMRNIVDGRFDPPARVAAGVSPALAECIQTALAPAADARFQDCGAFVTALGGALAPSSVAGSAVVRRPAADPRAAPERATGSLSPALERELIEARERGASSCWFCGGPPAGDTPPYILPLCRQEQGRWETSQLRIPYCGDCRGAHRRTSALNTFGTLGAILGALALSQALADGEFGGVVCGLLCFLFAYGIVRAATTSRLRKPLSHYKEYPILRWRQESGWKHATPPKQAGG